MWLFCPQNRLGSIFLRGRMRNFLWSSSYRIAVIMTRAFRSAIKCSHCPVTESRGKAPLETCFRWIFPQINLCFLTRSGFWSLCWLLFFGPLDANQLIMPLVCRYSFDRQHLARNPQVGCLVCPLPRQTSRRQPLTKEKWKRVKKWQKPRQMF